MTIPRDLILVALVVLALLLKATIVALLLQLVVTSDKARLTVANLTARIYAWWAMAGLVLVAVLAGFNAILVLFALISFLALREFITLTPTRRSDHRTLFWAFFVITPIQYLLIWAHWYQMLAIFVPVYAFIFVAITGTLRGDATRYVERTARIQWAIMLCVYCLSHIPALLILNLRDFAGRNINLILFLLLVVQLSDVFQYVFGKLLGRHQVAPHLSPNKTWEGLLGGLAVATAVGAALHPITPFTLNQAAAIAFILAALGFAGGAVMSAVKRDAGIKDFSNLIAGHGGILDRVDSLCLAAPIFFHLLRYYFSAPA